MNAIVQALVDELIIGDDDDAPMPTPASARSQAAALRRADAARKRDERAARRGAGIPDSRTIDNAIASALADVLRCGGAGALVARSGTVEGLRVAMRPVLARAIHGLVERGTDKAVAASVIQGRLLRVTPAVP